uniref:Uncharacterized protein n=1 Tax=Arundo donax TaxID=35708 RepID=A0A0A9AV16_ARUDO
MWTASGTLESRKWFWKRNGRNCSDSTGKDQGLNASTTVFCQTFVPTKCESDGVESSCSFNQNLMATLCIALQIHDCYG